MILTGTSSGLGSALFDAYLAEGARVCALARRFTPGQQRLAAAEPDRVVLHHIDLADGATLPDGPAMAALLIPVRPGDAVLLVHNAAVVTPIGLIGALEPKEIDTAVQVNVVAPLQLTNTFLGAVPTWTLPPPRARSWRRRYRSPRDHRHRRVPTAREVNIAGVGLASCTS